MILGRRWAAPAYWAAAVVLAIVGAVGGARWGLSQAPEFTGENNNGAPATSASHLIYTTFGALVCGLAVLAVACGIFFVLWARGRRSSGGTRTDGRHEGGVDHRDQLQEMDLDEVADMFTADDRPFDGQPPPPR